jgi:hypothetical protein
MVKLLYSVRRRRTPPYHSPIAAPAAAPPLLASPAIAPPLLLVQPRRLRLLRRGAETVDTEWLVEEEALPRDSPDDTHTDPYPVGPGFALWPDKQKCHRFVQTPYIGEEENGHECDQKTAIHVWLRLVTTLRDVLASYIFRGLSERRLDY